MSSIATSHQPLSKRSYIATAAFNDDFFTFTSTVDGSYQTIYTRAAVTGATAGNCPKGRVLRENGKKIVPGQFANLPASQQQYYVGVFDSYSGLNGYIDPNSPIFAPYNSDKPYWIDVTNATHLDGTDPGPGGLKDRGAPVLTNGIIETRSTIDASGAITTTSYVASRSENLTQYSTSGGAYTTGNMHLYMDPTLSNVFFVSTANSTMAGGGNTINFYCGTSSTTAVTPPSGTTIQVIFDAVGTTNTFTPTAIGGNIVGGTIALTATRKYVITYVSNGTKLYYAGFQETV